MTCGAHFDRPEPSFTEHRAQALGVIRSSSEPQYAEQVTESSSRGRPEIDSQHAPTGFQDATDFSQSSTLQLVRQVVKHQVAQHHVEVVV